MKTFLFITAIFILSYISHSFAQSHHHDHPSTHGMIIFGKEKIYISHLPMFHTPHDYQVIAEVELDTASQAVYHSLRKAHPDELMTLVPEVFVLPEMVKTPKVFKGQLYLGHFERGGELQPVKMKVLFKKIILNTKLNPDGTRPLKYEALLFGEKNDQYLVHLIKCRPDFDQLLAVKADIVSGTIKFPAIKQETELSEEEYETDSGKLLVKKSLYLEHEDLTH